MTLTEKPKYSRGQPEFKTVILKKNASDANRVPAIQSGAAQVVTDLNPQEFNSLSKSSNVTVDGFYNDRTTSLIFGFNFAPWNLPKSIYLRQAIANAMPYDQIINKAYYGEAKQWFGQVFSNANGYVPIKS